MQVKYCNFPDKLIKSIWMLKPELQNICESILTTAALCLSVDFEGKDARQWLL